MYLVTLCLAQGLGLTVCLHKTKITAPHRSNFQIIGIYKKKKKKRELDQSHASFENNIFSVF